MDVVSDASLNLGSYFIPYPPTTLNMYHVQYRKNRLLEISRQRLELNREHNSLIPIAALPDDILLRVFLMSYEKEDEYDTIVTFMKTMRYTSQVCSYWRDITLGSPLHWCQISNPIHYKSGMLWLQELLRRSGSSPLNVEIKFTSKEDLEMTNTILQHSSRFRRLDISKDVPNAAFDDHLQCALKKPMHYLHSLTIARHVKGSNQTVIMPDAPSLHCVHLINTPMTFNASSLSTITELELSRDNASEGFTHALLYVIRDMQSLKSLITNCGTALPQVTTAGIPFTRNVRLPYLETMRLSGMLYHCAYITLSVEIPTSCFCSIICAGLNRSQRSNFPLMTQAITKILSGCRAPEALFINISRYNFEIAGVEGDTAPAKRFMELEFGWNSDFRDDVKTYFISPFRKQFFLSVKHLQLGIGITKNRQPDKLLHTLICPCANMQTLELIGGDSVGILFSFIQSHEGAFKILPVLQSLVITGLKAHNFKPKEVDSIILLFIKWRSDIGLPFKSIRLSGNRFRNQPLVDQLTKIEGLEVTL